MDQLKSTSSRAKISHNRPKEQKNPLKAYKNVEFLSSPDARVIRMVAEFVEPLSRFRHQGIKDTIVFFGSARTKSSRSARKNLQTLRQQAARAKTIPPALARKIRHAETDLLMSQYYEDASELASLLTKWSMRLHAANRFVVCSGGGPGIMEAANRGAKRVSGKSVGLNISLPFEQAPNPYITDKLNFEFHYFFMRKFWFVYLAKALVMFPGGFGTLDELMEVLTLLQTGKIKKKMTVVLYGESYWRRIINFSEMVRLRVISDSDLKLFRFANSPKEAYDYLVKELTKNYPHETTMLEIGT
ncbi:MAG: TIGR00730 family Rossman fold protein [Ignavibacteria bacterium]|nr:TIGR00730 family Rossman fold protein [Ignavibacteria bacterium]